MIHPSRFAQVPMLHMQIDHLRTHDANLVSVCFQHSPVPTSSTCMQSTWQLHVLVCGHNTNTSVVDTMISSDKGRLTFRLVEWSRSRQQHRPKPGVALRPRSSVSLPAYIPLLQLQVHACIAKCALWVLLHVYQSTYTRPYACVHQHPAALACSSTHRYPFE